MRPARDPGSRPPIPFAAVVVVLVLLVGAGFLVRSVLAGDGAIPPAPEPHGTGHQASGGPSAASATPSPSAEARGSLVIHGAGDVSLDPSYITTYATQGYAYAWSGLNGLFEHDDLSVVNLECAVSKLGSPVPKEFNFRGDPAALPAMRKAGVDVANMANNHSYDFGPEALLDTRKNILDAGVAPVGAGKDPAEALAPAIFERNGWKIAVVGLDEVVDPPDAVAATGHPGTAAGHDFSAMLEAVKAADQRADLVVVDIHWGVELDTVPRSYQVTEGHRLVDAGADIIFGGHSHRLQPLDVYRGKPIFWSLGNFVWPNFSAEGSRTGVAEVHVSPDGDLRARILPAFIQAPGHPVLQRG
ncbi:MAG: CapA family protein [Actinomycetota bacterium]|nr:CapA family protein [Actinomycetota bacterium]